MLVKQCEGSILQDSNRVQFERTTSRGHNWQWIKSGRFRCIVRVERKQKEAKLASSHQDCIFFATFCSKRMHRMLRHIWCNSTLKVQVLQIWLFIPFLRKGCTVYGHETWMAHKSILISLKSRKFHPRSCMNHGLITWGSIYVGLALYCPIAYSRMHL